MKIDACFYLGFFRKSPGNKKLLSLEIDTDEPEKYQNLESIFVRLHNKDENLIPFFVQSVVSRKNNLLTLQLDPETSDMDSTMLVGKEVYLPLSDLPKLSGNKFYFHEIIGFSVLDTQHGPLGIVKAVQEFPAQEVLTVSDCDIDILVPLIEETIVEVDRSKKSLTIVTPPGLVEMYRN